MLDYLDEPFADSSALPVYILSKQTRQKVTVALSGDGADEMFAGYNKHMGEYRVRQRGMAEEVIAGLDFLWEVLPKSRNAAFGNRVRQFQRFAEGMASSAKSRYWRLGRLYVNGAMPARCSARSCQEAFRKTSTASAKTYPEGHHRAGDINEVLLTDMNLVLQSDMLTKVDLMSMANSLEVRTPFLDYKVVNFAFSLPETSKINKNMKKRIVQDAFRDRAAP